MDSDFLDGIRLMGELADRQWTCYRDGDRDTVPNIIVAVKNRAFVSDVIALRGHDLATAYRALDTDGDPLRATHGIRHFVGRPGGALAAVAAWSGEFGAPYPLPEQCRLARIAMTPCV
jgi:hypothetical protein